MSKALLTLLQCWAGPEAVNSGVRVPQFLAQWDTACGTVTWLLLRQKLYIGLFLTWTLSSHQQEKVKSMI